jgi:hypothetical protein
MSDSSTASLVEMMKDDEIRADHVETVASCQLPVAESLRVSVHISFT